MKNLLMGALALVTAATLTGCANIPGKTNLKEVAERAGVSQVTTGDGTFENYKATGHHSSTEIGIGLGLFTIKLLEIYPAASNEDLMTNVATAAKDGGADAVINAEPQKTLFIPIFLIAGPYIDTAKGTGISSN